MKNLFLIFFAFFCILEAIAQAPQKFNYQGVARNAQGEAMANQSMALKIGILSAADAEVPDYEEIHQVKTNEFGLYTLEIGGGEAVTGTMASVRWETGNKYVRVAIDPQGGNNFDVVGTNQLLSVPYALYSDKAGMARKVSNTLRGGQANYISKFDSTGSSSSEIQSVLYDNGNNVGIGTTTPLAKIHVQANGASLQGMRIQNLNPTGVGRFLFYNDSTNSYGTMTKYGTTFPGQPSGLAGLYPYANLWTFGNNAIVPNDGTGRTLISSAGNVGISYIKNGAFKLKFHADYNSGNVGIGGNTTPRAKIHLNNTDSTYINLMLSTNTTGHTPTDGLNIAVENKDASIINRENGGLIMGTLNTERMRVTVNGNVGIGTSTPNASAITEMNSTTQGFLPPRMTTVQRNAINLPVNGLVIFNITTGCINYCYNGGWYQWCGNAVATVGTIGTINCASAVHTGTLTATQAASGVSSNINYTGGNGGVHGGQTVNSTGVTGLTATLLPGNFANGAGTLTYTISGTPNTNGTASFAILIGGKTCTLNRTVVLPQPTVTALNCANATNAGTLQQGLAATGVSSSIPYTGGNGVAYTAQTINSTGVTGLTATLTAGTLANGTGNLVYTISGTPNSSGTANFTIVFGGQTCNLTLTVTSPVPNVTALNCNNTITTGTLQALSSANGVSCLIPYLGGNGLAYPTQTFNSTGVTGLIATLNSDTLENGSGNLLLNISGTPISTGIASFTITFGGQSCILTLNVISSFYYTYSAIPYLAPPQVTNFVTLGDDAMTGSLPIGFNFSFYGNTYSQFEISSNGFITFDLAQNLSGCCQGQILPDPIGPNNVIAAVWDDLYPPGNGNVGYGLFGTAPNRYLVVSWSGTPFCCGANADVYTSIFLFETSNIIEIHTSYVNNASPATMGLESIGGLNGIAVPNYNQSNILINFNQPQGHRFTP